MRKDFQFIELYCAICDHYDTALLAVAQRLSNNFCPQLTDEECITIYLWGITQQKYEVKAIYEYILDHYKEWSPKLPSYQAFNNRICNLADSFEMLADIMLRGMNLNPGIIPYLTDSMPIIVANSKRSSSAQVAHDWDGIYSAAVSATRQPIESFFNWLQAKTHIETASKV